MNRILLLLTLVACSLGCRKPLPSPDFIEASGSYTNLLAVNGEGAYSTPQMDAVVEQLGRVRERSSDYAAARALIDAIAKERSRIDAERIALEKLALAPPTAPNFPALNAVAAAPVEEKAPAAAEDPFAVVTGASWAPLQKKFFGCLVSRGPITLMAPDGGGTQETEGFELYESADCRKRVPSMVQNVAMVSGGRIANVAAKSSLVTSKVPAPTAPSAR